MIRIWWQKLRTQGQSRAHRGFHSARVQQRLRHKPFLEPLEDRTVLSLVAPVVYNLSQQPEGIAVGDLRGDGRLDVVTANASGSVSVLLGNGDGTFQPAVRYSVGSNQRPSAVAVGDFTGDGIPDLVTVNVRQIHYGLVFGSFSVLVGNGNGTFQTEVTHSLPSAPSTLAAGDFTG